MDEYGREPWYLFIYLFIIFNFFSFQVLIEFMLMLEVLLPWVLLVVLFSMELKDFEMHQKDLIKV